MDSIQIIDALAHYQTLFDEERLYCKQLLTFLLENPNFWQRTNLKGHVTASAWVLNQEKTKALLIHHAGLNKWFQPGGHVEPEDKNLQQAAERELMEECDIQVFTSLSPQIFDIDIHIIPAKKDVAEHLHYDIRFAFLVSEQAVKAISNAEIKALKWVDLLDLIERGSIQQSIRRMALKSHL